MEVYYSRKTARNNERKSNFYTLLYAETMKINELFPKVIKTELGEEVVKEHKFHPTRKWRFDYAILEKKIAIEVEGGIFGAKSRHTTGIGYKNDLEKYNNATVLGWRIIRVIPQDLMKSSTIEMIRQIIENDRLSN